MCRIDKDYLPPNVPCPFKQENNPMCYICNREKGMPEQELHEGKRVDELVEERLGERTMYFGNRTILTRSYDYIFTGSLCTS